MFETCLVKTVKNRFIENCGSVDDDDDYDDDDDDDDDDDNNNNNNITLAYSVS